MENEDIEKHCGTCALEGLVEEGQPCIDCIDFGNGPSEWITLDQIIKGDY